MFSFGTIFVVWWNLSSQLIIIISLFATKIPLPIHNDMKKIVDGKNHFLFYKNRNSNHIYYLDIYIYMKKVFYTFKTCLIFKIYNLD